jgi:hypothetical protein
MRMDDRNSKRNTKKSEEYRKIKHFHETKVEKE